MRGIRRWDGIITKQTQRKSGVKHKSPSNYPTFQGKEKDKIYERPFSATKAGVVATTLERIHVTDCNANAVMEDFPLSALSPPHARWGNRL